MFAQEIKEEPKLEVEAKKEIKKEEIKAGTKNKELPKEVISITRSSDADQLTTPSAISVITNKEIKEKNARSLPDLLGETPGVMIQKTSYGQASPFIIG
jgi:outer membrane receptor for ferrienterochelin and colicin